MKNEAFSSDGTDDSESGSNKSMRNEPTNEEHEIGDVGERPVTEGERNKEKSKDERDKVESNVNKGKNREDEIFSLDTSNLQDQDQDPENEEFLHPEEYESEDFLPPEEKEKLRKKYKGY